MSVYVFAYVYKFLLTCQPACHWGVCVGARMSTFVPGLCAFYLYRLQQLQAITSAVSGTEGFHHKKINEQQCSSGARASKAQDYRNKMNKLQYLAREKERYISFYKGIAVYTPV